MVRRGSTVRVRQRAWRDPAWLIGLRDRSVAGRAGRDAPSWKRFGNGAGVATRDASRDRRYSASSKSRSAQSAAALASSATPSSQARAKASADSASRHCASRVSAVARLLWGGNRAGERADGGGGGEQGRGVRGVAARGEDPGTSLEAVGDGARFLDLAREREALAEVSERLDRGGGLAARSRGCRVRWREPACGRPA